MFEFNLVDEFYIFIIAITHGFIIGLVYDFYRAIRYFSKPKHIRSFIEDLLLWIIITAVFFIFLLYNTEGVVRGFVLLGFLVGFVFYLKLISRYNFPFLIKLFKLIFNLINEIIKIVVYPYKQIKRIIKKRSKKCILLLKTWFRDIKKYKRLISKKK